MAGREQLRAAIVAQLEQASASPGLAPILEPDAADLSRQLTEMLREGDGDHEGRYLLGWLHWYRYLALPQGEDEADYEAAIGMFTECFIADVDGLPEAVAAAVAARAVPAARALLNDAAASPDRHLALSAVGLWRRVVAATPAGDTRLAGRISSLGSALLVQYQRAGVLADLDAAIEAQQAVVDATPENDPDRAGNLSNLGIALQTRFDRTENPADLHAAIRAQKAAVRAAPADHPNRAMYLSNLGAALKTNFDWTGQLTELEAAIDTQKAAVAATADGDDGLHRHLTNLAVALLTRFKRTGALEDAGAAIQAQQAAISAAPASHPDRPCMMANLGGMLKLRFERTSDMDDLDRAVTVGQGAVDMTPAGHPDRAGRLSNVGNALQERYERTGDLADLDSAIEAHRAAVHVSADDDIDRIACLSNLGSALHARYRRTGAVADLDAAIQATQAAVDSLPGDHPDRGWHLANLGIDLRSRFDHSGDIADLEAGIKAGQQAIAATAADHPDQAKYQANLATFLLARFAETQSPADLEAAIAAGKAAADATPQDHQERPRRLTVLGQTVRTRYELADSPADAETAIDLLQAAVRGTRNDDLMLASRLSSLGDMLALRSGRTGNQTDRDAAISAHERAAALELAPPSTRITAARTAANLLAKPAPGRAADLLDGAVQLLGEVAPRRLARRDQQQMIGQFAGLASEAAALALADPRPGRAAHRATRALRLLEAGRAILISQALESRHDLTDLRRQHPDLAARFADLRDRLDQPDDSHQPAMRKDTISEAAPGYAPEARRQLARQFTETLAEIRALPRFATFGLPPATDELLRQAEPGPVVTFNISGYRCDALLLTPTGITEVELPGLTQDALSDQVGSFYRALRGARTGASRAERKDAQRGLLNVLEWLWDVAAEPVLDALGYGQSPRPGSSWPRLWWAPGGMLGTLPVHAAGHHAEAPCADGRRTVMDRVICSYTPTIRALRHARQQARHQCAAGPTLIVAMPVTPGLPRGGELPDVPAEVAELWELAPDPVLLADGDALGPEYLGRSAGSPTKASVIANLPQCSVAHFACHGYSDPGDPAQSLLLLRDYHTDPFTVAGLAPIRLDQLQLAYLSACNTAFSSATELLDEAIHLGSAFNIAGSRHVIGTLWEIGGHAASDIAAAFYRQLLTTDGALDTSRAAAALHHAVRAARDASPLTPGTWAAHVHVGP